MISTSEARERRDLLLDSIGPENRFYHLFEYVEGLSFFAKDCQGVLLAANHHLVALYGFKTEDEFIGHTDFDLLPRRLAEKFRQDDLAIMQSRQPVRNLVELFLNRQGIPSWFVTSKIPIISRTDKVLGIMGIIQDYQQYEQRYAGGRDIRKAMDFIYSHYREKISIKALAESCEVSLRQFERKFKGYFNLSPQQYIMKMRIHDSCEMLRTHSLSIGDIAFELGFYDQSSFTVKFKKAMGLTPLQYRKQFI
ncbi:MAG: AraC family transcriptional regulator [Verrucomicrobiales bacterium]|jgi:PAS domain S-box-containing protein|nr:AraC family transcriptional regulator [Verrucomicrobiales bacterium]MDF1787662.1 AraC family transcriptional regulator [Verrucomicrobiales bacterium]